MAGSDVGVCAEAFARVQLAQGEPALPAAPARPRARRVRRKALPRIPQAPAPHGLHEPEISRRAGAAAHRRRSRRELRRGRRHRPAHRQRRGAGARLLPPHFPEARRESRRPRRRGHFENVDALRARHLAQTGARRGHDHRRDRRAGALGVAAFADGVSGAEGSSRCRFRADESAVPRARGRRVARPFREERAEAHRENLRDQHALVFPHPPAPAQHRPRARRPRGEPRDHPRVHRRRRGPQPVPAQRADVQVSRAERPARRVGHRVHRRRKIEPRAGAQRPVVAAPAHRPGGRHAHGAG